MEEVSFEIEKGEFVSLVGKSGSGKTTILKLLLAEETPTSGTVLFDGVDVHSLRRSDLPSLRKRIGVIFQDYKLLPSKTIYENVAYALEVSGASEERISREIPKVLDIVGLEDRAESFPAELSGGEKQRVAIARALVHRPEVILADEPTGNLDPYNTYEIVNLLLKINKLGTTLVLATHNKDVVNSIEKRVLVVDEGKIIRDDRKGRFVL